jgi:ABC-type transport system involved in cytochrome bd biosynthesis fused ATPase/permease subunit
VGEKVLAALRLELFRTLLMQRIQFYDNHSASELTALISVDLDTMRSFVFK